jgi:hypothetical protein
MPGLHRPGHNQHAQHERQRPHRRLGDREQAPLRIAVGRYAAPGTKQHEGQELQRDCQAERGG